MCVSNEIIAAIEFKTIKTCLLTMMKAFSCAYADTKLIAHVFKKQIKYTLEQCNKAVF